jgi:pantoate--beta-alanine ligase
MAGDLNVATRVVVSPTVRESDGLAMSSRNRYLDPEQRRQATVLSRGLELVRTAFAAGERDAKNLAAILTRAIADTPLARLDYASVVDALTLQPIDQIDRPALVALAVSFAATRLIDNLTLTP